MHEHRVAEIVIISEIMLRAGQHAEPIFQMLCNHSPEVKRLNTPPVYLNVGEYALCMQYAVCMQGWEVVSATLTSDSV